MAFSEDSIEIIAALTPDTGVVRLNPVLADFTHNVLETLSHYANLFPFYSKNPGTVNPNLDTVKAALHKPRATVKLRCQFINCTTGSVSNELDLLTRQYNSISLLPVVTHALKSGYEVVFKFTVSL